MKLLSEHRRVPTFLKIRSVQAYDDVLSFINAEVMNLTCKKFTTDYEKGGDEELIA